MAQDLPLTITTQTRSVIVGGPDDPIETYDLTADAAEQVDISGDEGEATASLVQTAIVELRKEGATPELLVPRQRALSSFRS